MEPGEIYWNAIEPIWDAISIDTPESFEQTFKDVPHELGLLYAAHFCQSEVCNGGFTQFFSNSTGVLAPEAVEGFEAIGQPKVADIVRTAMSMLGAPYPRDRAARWALLDRMLAPGDAPPRGFGHGRYKNIDLYRPLEDDFYSLLATESGGFEHAADRYTARFAPQSPSASSTPESEKEAMARAVARLSPADAKQLKNHLQTLKADVQKMRERIGQGLGDS